MARRSGLRGDARPLDGRRPAVQPGPSSREEAARRDARIRGENIFIGGETHGLSLPGPQHDIALVSGEQLEGGGAEARYVKGRAAPLRRPRHSPEIQSIPSPTFANLKPFNRSSHFGCMYRREGIRPECTP